MEISALEGSWLFYEAGQMDKEVSAPMTEETGN